MERRSFLKLFAAAAAASMVGGLPALAYGSTVYTVRYLEAYDPMRGAVVHRLDIANGIPLRVPVSVAKGMVYEGVAGEQILAICDALRAGGASIPDRAVLGSVMRLPDLNGMIGIDWR